MSCTDCRLTIKINKPIPGHAAGSRVTVQADSGRPLSKFWRDRLKDAQLDGCVEVVTKPKKVAGNDKD